MVYLVERHRDDYHGAVDTQVAADADAAMRVAESMREGHRAVEWRMRVSDRNGARVSFVPDDGESGRVTVRERPLVGAQ